MAVNARPTTGKQNSKATAPPPEKSPRFGKTQTSIDKDAEKQRPKSAKEIRAEQK
jgi:hypothetical protein